jgi:hypothetical protein
MLLLGKVAREAVTSWTQRKTLPLLQLMLLATDMQYLLRE